MLGKHISLLSGITENSSLFIALCMHAAIGKLCPGEIPTISACRRLSARSAYVVAHCAAKAVFCPTVSKHHHSTTADSALTVCQVKQGLLLVVIVMTAAQPEACGLDLICNYHAS